MLALLFAGMMFLSGCIEDLIGMKDMAVREVGLHGAKWEADSTEELENMLSEHCKSTCPGMDYRYEGTKYTVYEEGGMYIARDPKCICYDEKYAEKHGTFLD